MNDDPAEDEQDTKVTDLVRTCDLLARFEQATDKDRGALEADIVRQYPE